ncbi:DUF4870 family protein [Ostreibacterium oceani]|nr:hypothetical protein [Ostreibacterium oceani]
MSEDNQSNEQRVDDLYQSPKAPITPKQTTMLDENMAHPNSGTANAIYILYLVNIVVPFLGIIGVIMAYVKQSESPAWLQTHFRFQIRTFWIGILYVVIGIITLAIIIGFFILLFTTVWYIIRCAKGMNALSNRQPIENPASWLF